MNLPSSLALPQSKLFQSRIFLLVLLLVVALIGVGVFFFVRSMVTLSAVIFLVTPVTQVAAVSVLLLDDAGNTLHIASLSLDQVLHRAIEVGDHCYACTAGSGSSCGGALV